MAKCCSDSCSCKLEVGDDFLSHEAIEITGTGSAQDPFTVRFRGLDVVDSDDINLTLAWDDDDGYSLTATFAATSNLDSIGDVNAPAPGNAQVLGWDSATSKWTPRAPTTAATGAVDHDTSLAGDGSGGDPLGVNFTADAGIEDDSGVTLTDETKNSLVRRFADDAARSAADPAPVLNALSMLNDTPGRVDYWDGSDWVSLTKVVQIDTSAGFEYMVLSGAYDGGPVGVYTRSTDDTTDAAGQAVAIPAGDLALWGGILSVTVTPITTDSSDAWFPTLTPAVGADVSFTANRGDGDGALVSTGVSFLVMAVFYN